MARAFLRATLARARSGIKPAVFNARTADMAERTSWSGARDRARAAEGVVDARVCVWVNSTMM